MQTDLLRTVLALERPVPEAALVNGLAVDARALGGDLAALTSA